MYALDHFIKALDVAGTGTAGHSTTCYTREDLLAQVNHALNHLKPGDRIEIKLDEGDEDGYGG